MSPLKNFALFLIALIIIINSNISLSQSILKKELSNKNQQIYTKARHEAQKGNFEESNNQYKEILKSEPKFTEGILRIASNYFSLKDLANSLKYFKSAIDFDPNYDPEMYYSYALAAAENKQYILASQNFLEYFSRENENQKKKDKALKLSKNYLFIDSAYAHPVPFSPQKLSSSINTHLSEHSPSLSLDGNSIVFTRRGSQEDFYIAHKDSNGVFNNATAIDGLNTYLNEGAHSVSADGRIMVFTACDRKDAFGSCDLYYSVYENQKWSIPTNMGHVVNSASWDSEPTLSPDGRTLYFASNRKGTLGHSDIWMTYRDEKNKWVTPVNLGPEINSEGREETPFLHPDGETLYFRSDGRVGMGEFDIYYSKKNRTTGTWSKPINIGYPINTEGSESNLTVSLDGTTAYFSSNYDFTSNSTQDNLDIYSFELYEDARPSPTVFVRGVVYDKVTNLPLRATVIIQNTLDTINEYLVNTDQNGVFLNGITVGYKYSIIIKKDGYLHFSEFIDGTETLLPNIPINKTIYLQPIENVISNHKDTAIILHNIFFKSGSAELLKQSDQELIALFQLLNSDPKLSIKIIGHTDNEGSETDNQVLSLARANAVIQYLMNKGIQPNRLFAEGRGESSPISDNLTPEGRQKNRRTEFIIIK